MLEKSTIKKLSEHDWLTFVKHDANPSQTSFRFKSQANRAIKDLVLLADKLPNTIQKEIFSYLNIQELVKSILKENFDTDSDGEARRAHLAALLVKEGIEVCAQYYRSRVEGNPILNQPLLDQLYRISNFCEEIAYKVGSRDIYEDRTYLFCMGGTESHRRVEDEEIANFVRDTMGYKCAYKGGSFPEIEAIDGDGDPYTFRFDFEDDDGTKAEVNGTLRIHDETTEECVEEQKLIIKREGEFWYFFRIDK
jgi:hypothetical protein